MYSVVIKSPKKREEDRIKNEPKEPKRKFGERDSTVFKFGLFLYFTFVLPSQICLESCKFVVQLSKKVRMMTKK